MKRGRSAILLLVLAAGLGGYIYFVEMKRAPADEEPKKDRVFSSLDADQITAITLQASNGDQTTLHKQGAAWTLREPIETRADASEVSGVTSNLATLDISRLIDENPKSLEGFGLDTPRVKVGFTSADKTQQTLLLGAKTATGGDMYAKLENQPRVFLVPGWLESTFDRTSFQLRDKSVLSLDRDAVDRLSIIGAPGTIEIARDGEGWRLAQPVNARADTGAVDTLLTRLSSGQMQAMVAEEPKTLDTYGLLPPKTTVRALSAGKTVGELLIGGPSGESAVHARDASRPMVFTVDTTLASELQRPAAEYRAKDLFVFRPFNANQVTVTRDGVARVFDKTQTGTGAQAADAWTQTSPAGAVPAATIEDIVSRLSTLRAESWSSSAPAAATPVLTVSATFDGSKQERVTFSRAGAEIVAVREGEPGAAGVAVSSFEDVIAILDGKPAS